MSKKYNPYAAVNAIYNLKGEWDNANNAGDSERKTAVAKKAQDFYAELRKNGYSDAADKLAASNYTQAKAINDYYAMTGRSATRPYFYSLGQKYGMSESDVDKLIGWNDATKEVSFGGKTIGKPDAIANGTSYWGDTSVLDAAFNDYISRTGTARSKDVQVNQENEKLFANYNREYEDLKSVNPFETEEGKAILAKYDLAGLQGRDNQAAAGGANNGGNIDSYAAANALRQQSALVNQGQQMVLSAHQQKLDHARNLLADMGVNIDRVFTESETEKQSNFERGEAKKKSDFAIEVEKSDISGYTPTSWIQGATNQFLNSDGTLKSEYLTEEFDNTGGFSAIIKVAEKSGDTELLEQAKVARAIKILGDYAKYGKYDDGNYTLPSAQRTADYDINKQAIDANVTINKDNNDAQIKLSEMESDNAIALEDKKYKNKSALEDQKYRNDLGLQDQKYKNNLGIISAETESEKELMGTAAMYNQSGNSTAVNSDTMEAEPKAKPNLTAAQTLTAIKNGEISQTVIDAYNYYYGTNYTVANPPRLGNDSAETNSSTKPALSESQVKSWVNYLNKSISDEHGENYKALKQTGKNKYVLANAESLYVIKRVYESDDLTQEQKEYLLFDKFGITEDQVYTAMNDKHQ